MSSQTSLVAEQVRLQQWAAQIQDCKNCPADMKVETWCSEHGITKANYYYRLKRVVKHVWRSTIQNRRLWSFLSRRRKLCPGKTAA